MEVTRRRLLQLLATAPIAALVAWRPPSAATYVDGSYIGDGRPLRDIVWPAARAARGSWVRIDRHEGMTWERVYVRAVADRTVDCDDYATGEFTPWR